MHGPNSKPIFLPVLPNWLEIITSHPQHFFSLFFIPLTCFGRYTLYYSRIHTSHSQTVRLYNNAPQICKLEHNASAYHNTHYCLIHFISIIIITLIHTWPGCIYTLPHIFWSNHMMHNYSFNSLHTFKPYLSV